MNEKQQIAICRRFCIRLTPVSAIKWGVIVWTLKKKRNSNDVSNKVPTFLSSIKWFVLWSRFIRKLRTSEWLAAAAKHMDTLPSFVSNFGEAPLSVKSFTTFKYPALAAKWRAVQPFLSQAFMSAPCPNNNDTMNMWPLAAARWSAVRPLLSLTWSCVVDLLNSKETTEECPPWAARWSGIAPYG